MNNLELEEKFYELEAREMDLENNPDCSEAQRAYDVVLKEYEELLDQ